MSQNPYVGPRAFEEGESRYFFGRNEEVEILTGQVMARRVSLLYAPSGAGKSSVLRAGLIPELTRQETIGRGRRRRTYQKMAVLPILTVSAGIPGQVKQQIKNIYVFSALLSLLPQADPNELAESSLSSGLGRHRNGLVSFEDEASSEDEVPSSDATLLVFDQFEEIFTYLPTRRAERRDFFKQVSEALLEYSDIHVLFSMREDFIARLTPHERLLPEPLQSRFRLEPLKREAALQAIRQPAQQANYNFGDGVAEALVDNLRRIQSGQKSPVADSTILNAPDSQFGPYIEPVHLQIVCRQLWANLPPDRTTIYTDDVKAFGDVDQALTDFYETTIKRVIEQPDVSERGLRNWFSQQLITPAHTRGLVYRGEEETSGLPNLAVDMLAAAYIIRADIRGNDIWYELAHDRLLEPILHANQAWERTYYNPLAAARLAWVEAGHAPYRLLTGADLEEAQQYAATHPKEITAGEREFLAESMRQDMVEREKAQQAAQRRRQVVLVTAGAVIVLLLLTLWALFSARQASQARDTAEAASTAAIVQRDTAETAEAGAQAQKATAEAASTAAIVERDNAATAQANANLQKSVAQAASTAAIIQEQFARSALVTAEAERNSAVSARATLVAYLETILTQPTATRPPPPPAPRTPTTGDGQPPSPPSPPPNLNATATVVALEAQLAEIRATQTAVASILICSIPPPREIRSVWEQYEDQLGCPTHAFPIEGFFAEQDFENGHMFWAEQSGQFLVTVGGDSGTWHLFDAPTWPSDPEQIPCDYTAPEDLVKPVRGFGGLWCTQTDIRQAIGFATAPEYEVDEGNLLQAFEGGIMLRDSQGYTYILMNEDGSYVRQ